VTAGGVELGRFPDATAARAAARRLLAVGITPRVERSGDEHVLRVAPEEATAAAAALELTAPGGPTAADQVGGGEPGPTATESPDDAGRPTTAPSVTGAVSIFSSPEELAAAALLPPPPSATEPPPEETGPYVDDDGFMVVAVAPDEESGRELAASLVERGIGVELADAVETRYANPLMGEAGAVVLRVLEIDAPRALEQLGTEPPMRLAAPTPPPSPATASATSVGPPPTPTTPSRPSRPGAPPEPEPVHEYLGGRLRLTRRQLITAIVVYAAALILIPLTFFYLTRWVLDPGGGDPTDTIPGFSIPESEDE
jgi:hypothetical protein